MNPKKMPLVALIGLPNSGKSTLLNRLGSTGAKAVVAKEAHTTRDLNYAEDVWESMYLRFVDTGGLVPDPEDKIQKMIQVKTWSAVSSADLLIWVIDRRTNPDVIAQETLQKVWKSGKPFIIGINKVDNPNNEKDELDYVRFGAVDFINFSAANGYNLGFLMDKIVENLEKLGFEKSERNMVYQEQEEEDRKRKKDRRLKVVRQNQDGTFFIFRENSNEGPGLFQAVSKKEMQESVEKVNSIDYIISDLNKVLVSDSSFEEVNEEYLNFLIQAKSKGKKLFYLSNLSQEGFNNFKASPNFALFNGGLIGDVNTELAKPNHEIYFNLIEEYSLPVSKCLFIDDKPANVEAAREVGMWALEYKQGLTSVEKYLEKVEDGKVHRVPRIPKILFLGKPNVGKSTLFNKMVGKEIQIVTEIAGTTLSVNDTLVQREVKENNSDIETEE